MKKVKPYFIAEIENGDLTIKNSEKFHKYLKTLENKNGITKVKISVEKYRSVRSINQNNYYWGVIMPILGEWAGIDEYEYVTELHIPLKRMFLGREQTKVPINRRLFGKVFTTKQEVVLDEIRSTAKLKTDEFADYIDKIRRWAIQEHGVDIPEPNSIDYDEENYIPPFAK